MFLRFVFSTLAGQFNSATFVVLAFSGRMPTRQMVVVTFYGMGDHGAKRVFR